MTLENYSNFYSFMTLKFDKLSQAGQIALIVSINAFISYCYDFKSMKAKVKEDENFKSIMIKVIESYRKVFKLSLKFNSKTNLKAFADKYKCVNSSEITFICREFLRENDLTEKSCDYNLMFLKLFVSTLPTENIPSGWISYLQIFTRRFIKFPKHSDIFNGLGLIIKMISTIRNISNNELSQQLSKLTNDLYPFLSNHPEIVDNLISSDLFFKLDLEFFKSVKIEIEATNANLINSFKNCVLKRSSSNQGSILVEDSYFLDLYMKLEFGDLIEFESKKLSIINENDLLSYELFSRLAAQNSTDQAIENLLQLWSQSYFISDSRHQIKFMNLLKISLLSQTSDSLGYTLKRSFTLGPFNVSSLGLLTCFPFSLWRSLEKCSVRNQASFTLYL